MIQTRLFIAFVVLLAGVTGFVLSVSVFTTPGHGFMRNRGGSARSGCTDPAPSQAAAAGFHTEVYCWGPGDTLSEIDGTNTHAPGYKLYPPANNTSGQYFPTSTADYSMPSGKLVIQPRSGVDDSALTAGAFILSTCGSSTGTAPAPYNIGFFTNQGFYLEVKMEWDRTTGGGIGKYGIYAIDHASLNRYAPAPGALFGIEIDSPDTPAFELNLLKWDWTLNTTIGYDGAITVPTNPVNSGVVYGVLLTSTPQYTWYLNGAYNGNTAASPSDLAFIYSLSYCWGFLANTVHPNTVDYLRFWQAP